MRRIGAAIVVAGGLLAPLLLGTSARTQDSPPPLPSDRAFAVQLWNAMLPMRIVGDNPIRTAPFKGSLEHTEVIEYIETVVRVGYLEGLMILKRNYTGTKDDVVSIPKVWLEPQRYLSSITVMFRRRGYDPAGNDWFWAEYDGKGKIDSAGKVAHCIACHSKPGSKDYRLLPHPEP